MTPQSICLKSEIFSTNLFYANDTYNLATDKTFLIIKIILNMIQQRSSFLGKNFNKAMVILS